MTTKKEALGAIRLLSEDCEDAELKIYGRTKFSSTRSYHCLEILRSFVEEHAPADCECDELPNSRHCPKHNEPIGEDAVDDVVNIINTHISNATMCVMGTEQKAQLKSALLRMIQR